MGRRPKAQRSAEEKFAIVMEGLKSGKVSETCRKHEVGPALFYRWKDEMEKGALAALGKGGEAVADEKPLCFQEVLTDEYRGLRPDSGFERGVEPELISRMHRDPEPLSALCISGGGIRSATFALGAIQGLAEHGLLPRFDYMSTVSGGGYIGSWLTAWTHRAGGIASVLPCLRRDAPAPATGEPDPIQHLREYNSYLSPRGGAFSADVWTLIATVLRNIFLNWLVLIPLLAFVLIVPRLYLSALSFPELLHPEIFATKPPNYGAPQLNAIAQSPLVEWLLPLLSATLFATALFNTLRYIPGVGGRDHSPFAYVVKVLGPLVGTVLTFLMIDSLFYLGDNYEEFNKLIVVVLWTTLPCVAAWVLYLIVDRRPIRQRLGLILGPLFLAIAAMAVGTGAATWVTTNYVLPRLTWVEYVTIGPPTILLGYCLGSTLFVGLSSTFLKDEDREWMSRAVAGVLLFSVLWTGVCGVVLVLPVWALAWRTWAQSLLATVGALSAWLSTSLGTSVANANPGATARPKVRSRVVSFATILAPPLFIALLAVALSVLTNILLVGAHKITGIGKEIGWRDHIKMLEGSDPRLIVLLALGFLLLNWTMSRYVNINKFSLHGMYRDRLIRAYLGASNQDRKASQFTGFADSDNINMAALIKNRPFHVVNLTLNLVAGRRLAWQQRKAASFTVTPLHCGSPDVGFRPSSEYGGGITLGTAVAISGAAASPSMGYHSSPMVGFIMTLFNARLGSWLGNPGPPGERTWRNPGPLSSSGSLVKEALGQTSDQSEYVYLSDGGHFENLGLYEMVRRRCRTIVVIDGSCDPDLRYDDLGNALRKIRIDLRIPIDFADEYARPLRERLKRCALGTVRYSAVDGPGTDGRIIYLKPMLIGGEPPDVASYGAAHPDFPHQTTGDQWFDESQTESYRSLGLITVDEMCREWQGESFADFCRHLETVYLRPVRPAAASEGQ
jgi:hypothetical protein